MKNSNYITISIMGRKTKALIDTGSGSTCISKQFVDKIKAKIEPLKPGELSNLFAANGSRLKAIGTVDVDFDLNGLLVPFVAIVIENITDAVIIGTNFLNMTSAKLDFQSGIISFEDDLVLMPVVPVATKCDYVRLLSHTVLPANSESIINVRVSPKFANAESIIESRAPNESLNISVARCIVRPKRTKTVCQIVNPTDKPITLVRNQRIAFISKLDRDDKLMPMVDGSQTKVASISENQSTSVPQNFKNEQFKWSKSEQEAFVADYKFDINPELTESQREDLINLLYEFKSIFARNLSEIGCFKDYEVELETVPHRPYYISQYRIPEVQKQAAQDEIDQMVKAGLLISNDRSKYNSPYLILRKKDGSYRLVVDLRRGANTVCRTWTFNSKTVQEVIDEVASSNSNYFTSCDLYKAFWQLKLAPKSRDLISITAPNKLKYSYVRLPMGLNCSSSELNRALHTALHSELHTALTIFADDISIYNSEYKPHLAKIRAVFQLLKDNGLTISPSKTRLCYHDIRLLGYRISRNGIEVCSDKVRAIAAMPNPGNVKSLRRLLGMLNYFRTHIKNYAQRTYNLRQLLKKDAPWNFTDACKAECDDLKAALMSPEVLMPIRPNENFYIETDGAKSGFGWLIAQKDTSGILRPVYFGSASTNEYQKRYSAASLELQALFLSVKSLSHYLLGRKIYVTTDSVTVQFLNTLHLRTNREKRIAAYLQSFELHVAYRPGRQNSVADYLSRYFVDMSDAERVTFQATCDDDDLICTIKDNENIDEEEEEQSVSNNDERTDRQVSETLVDNDGHCCNDVNCNHLLCRICNNDCMNDINNCFLDDDIATVASWQRGGSQARPPRPAAQADTILVGPSVSEQRRRPYDTKIQDGRMGNENSQNFSQILSDAEIMLFNRDENSQSLLIEAFSPSVALIDGNQSRSSSLAQQQSDGEQILSTSTASDTIMRQPYYNDSEGDRQSTDIFSATAAAEQNRVDKTNKSPLETARADKNVNFEMLDSANTQVSKTSRIDVKAMHGKDVNGDGEKYTLTSAETANCILSKQEKPLNVRAKEFYPNSKINLTDNQASIECEQIRQDNENSRLTTTYNTYDINLQEFESKPVTCFDVAPNNTAWMMHGQRVAGALVEHEYETNTWLGRDPSAAPSECSDVHPCVDSKRKASYCPSSTVEKRSESGLGAINDFMTTTYAGPSSDTVPHAEFECQSSRNPDTSVLKNEMLDDADATQHVCATCMCLVCSGGPLVSSDNLPGTTKNERHSSAVGRQYDSSAEQINSIQTTKQRNVELNEESKAIKAVMTRQQAKKQEQASKQETMQACTDLNETQQYMQQDTLYEFKVNENLKITVVQNQSVSKLQANAFFCEVDGNLKPKTSVGFQIMAIGGKEIGEQCEEYIQEYGVINQPEVIYTVSEKPKMHFMHMVTDTIEKERETEDKWKSAKLLYAMALSLANEFETKTVGSELLQGIPTRQSLDALYQAYEAISESGNGTCNRPTVNHILLLTNSTTEATEILAALGDDKFGHKDVEKEQVSKETEDNKSEETTQELQISLSPADYEQDQYYGDFYRYLRDGTIPNDEKKAKTVLLKADNMFIDTDGLLYCLSQPRKNNEIRHLRCIPEKYTDLLISYLHVNSAHQALDRTYGILSRSYTFPRAYVRTMNYINACPRCALIRHQKRPHFAPLKPVKATELFEVISMDLVNYTKESDSGHKNALIAIDVMSGLTIVEPMRTASAAEALQIFVEKVVRRFSLPRAVRVDRGTTWFGIFQKALRQMGVKIYYSSSKNSQSNARSERVIRDLHQRLRALNANHKNWTTFLPFVEATINFTPHSRIGISAFQIAHGIPPRCAIDNLLSANDEQEKTSPHFSADEKQFLTNL